MNQEFAGTKSKTATVVKEFKASLSHRYHLEYA